MKIRRDTVKFIEATLLFLMASCLFAQQGTLRFDTLRDHVGATESVHLDVYFIGFPAELQSDLQAGVRKTLTGLNIEDAKPWWLPNIPKYGASAFAKEARATNNDVARSDLRIMEWSLCY